MTLPQPLATTRVAGHGVLGGRRTRQTRRLSCDSEYGCRRSFDVRAYSMPGLCVRGVSSGVSRAR
jgi:hypothetical protein